MTALFQKAHPWVSRCLNESRSIRTGVESQEFGCSPEPQKGTEEENIGIWVMGDDEDMQYQSISSRISECTVPTWVLNCPWRTWQNNSRSCFSWLLALSSLTLGVADTICWPHVASNLPREAWQEAMPMVEPIWHTVSQSLGLASWSTHYLHLQCQWSFKWGQAHHGTPIMKHMKL